MTDTVFTFNLTWIRPHADERPRVAVASSSVGLVGWCGMRVVGQARGTWGSRHTGHFTGHLESGLTDAQVRAFCELS